MAELVAVAGSIAQRPWRGGHAWVFLQYLLGFRRLGYQVLFLDRLSPGMLPDSDWPPRGATEWLRRGLGPYCLRGDYPRLLDGGDPGESIGIPRQEALQLLRSSVALIDVMGFLRDEEMLAATPRRV